MRETASCDNTKKRATTAQPDSIYLGIYRYMRRLLGFTVPLRFAVAASGKGFFVIIHLARG